MRTPVEELIRRLISLGLPLAIGCSSSSLGNQPPPIGCHNQFTFNQVIVVSRPTQNPDGGRGATIEDWDACAQTMQCGPLCEEIMPSGFGTQVTTCAVVGDAGTDATVDFPPPDNSEPALDVHLVYSYADCTGRRPAGFSPRRRCARGSKVGRWFADASVLEAASVPAFRRLAAELAAHRAPASLVRDARQAIVDEIRHHRLTAAVARENGAAVAPRRIRPAPVRGLVAMAAENAREGCVRETFGAATAAFQARHAADPRLRAVMTSIARDEARHALLAWQIDAWVRAVQPSSVRRLTAERAAAARALASEIASAAPPDPSLARALGLPPAPVLRQLVGGAQDLLWDAIA